jgi:hypothetical protein
LVAVQTGTRATCRWLQPLDPGSERAAISAWDLIEDLAGLRESPQLLLREDESPVEHDLELSARTSNERGVEATGLPDLGRQTGSPRKVASLHAVRDFQLGHAILPVLG